MTKEIRDIISAFRTADKEGRQAVLATIVHVEGSSYRMPGARMLVEDNGRMTGAISGGCLEGDALRKAMQASIQGQNKLVTYDTLHEDDIEFGVQLGCNGVVHILFEPVNSRQPNNPINLLEKFAHLSTKSVLVTLFSLRDFSRPHPGTCLLLNEHVSENLLGETGLGTIIYHDAANVLADGTSVLQQYDTYGLSAFFELIHPPVSLTIIGAGNDTMPLVNMATILGWHLTLVDGRATHVTVRRFPTVHKLIVADAREAINYLQPHENRVIVIMTHNYNYDFEIVRSLLHIKCRYIGALGPKRRMERILAELRQQGETIPDEFTSILHGPVGLDIGAETPEEIALSIIAEVKAVVAGRQGGSLRLRQQAIHTRPGQVAKHGSPVLKNAK